MSLFVLAYMLPISSCVRKLITASFITVALGNFSAFQPVQKADSQAEPRGITSLTVVTLTKIPHTAHMTGAISHQETLS